MTTPGLFWQGDQRWGAITLGAGPSNIAAAGCVLSALTAAAVRLAARDLNPGSANLLLQATRGAFVGDELVVPIAAPAVGLDSGPLIAGDDAIRAMLRATLHTPNAAALLRLEVSRPDGTKSGHTVLGVNDADSIIECLDPACPSQDGIAQGWCALSWANLCNASLVRWGKEPRTYHVVAARELRKHEAIA